MWDLSWAEEPILLSDLRSIASNSASCDWICGMSGVAPDLLYQQLQVDRETNEQIEQNYGAVILNAANPALIPR